MNISCPKCGKSYEIGHSYLNNKVKCSKCSSVFVASETLKQSMVFQNDPVEGAKKIIHTEMNKKTSKTPSYWAMYITSLILTFIGFCIIIIPISSICIKKMSKNPNVESLEKQLASLKSERSNLLKNGRANPANLKSLISLDESIAGTEKNLIIAKNLNKGAEISWETLIIIFFIVQGVVIIAFAQFLSAIRDMARNSFRDE